MVCPSRRTSWPLVLPLWGVVLLWLALPACDSPSPTTTTSLATGWEQLRQSQHVAQRTTYTGRLAGQPATLVLDRDGSGLSGSLEQNRRWPLQGTWTPDQQALVLSVPDGAEAILRGHCLPGGSLRGEWTTQDGRRVDSAYFQPVTQTFFLQDSLLIEGALHIAPDTLGIMGPDSACHLRFAAPVLRGLRSEAIARQLNKALGPPPRRDLGAYMAYCLSAGDSATHRTFERTYEVHALLPGWLSLSYFYTGPDTAYSRSVLAGLRSGELADPGILLGSAWPEGLSALVAARIRAERGADWEVDFSHLPAGMHLEIYPQQLVVRLDPLALGAYAPGSIRLPFSYAELAPILPADAPLAQLLPAN